MYNDREIRHLFQKYIENQCTEEECEQLLGCLSSPDNKQVVKEILREQLEDDAEEQPHLYTNPEWVRRTFAKVQTRIAESDQAEEPVRIGQLRPAYWQMAATLTGLLLLAGLGYKWSFREKPEKMVTEKTAYGEIRTITLPDHSTVILNGNSILKYPEKWTQNREVWVDGEAYFSVTHTADHRKFVVHASDECSVEVLGTEFNVSDRQSQMRVTLDKGSIKLSVQEEQGIGLKTAKPTEMLMTPGELVEFKAHSGHYYRKSAKLGTYSAWKDQKLILNNTSLHEISQNLKETYGLTLQINDPVLGQQKVSGSISTESEDRILKQLEQLFKVRIDRQGQVVTFHSL